MKAEPLHYTIEKPESLPPKVKRETKKLKDSTSSRESAVIVGDRTYLIIAFGERPTGGFSVHVSKVEQLGNTLHVYAQEKTPPKGSMVIQVISYPFTVVSVKGHYDDVTFHVDYADND